MSNLDLYFAVPRGVERAEIEKSFGVEFDLGIQKKDAIIVYFGGVGILYKEHERMDLHPFKRDWGFYLIFFCASKLNDIRMALATHLYCELVIQHPKAPYYCWLADGRTLFFAEHGRLFLNNLRRDKILCDQHLRDAEWLDLPDTGPLQPEWHVPRK